MRACIVAAVVLSGRAASASGPQLETSPTLLEFGHAAFDVPSATQRVTAKNVGEAVGALHDVHVDPPYVIVNHGGGLGAGQSEFWDIACRPGEPGPATGFLWIDVCGATCEDEWTESVTLTCTAGLLDTNDPQLGLAAYAFETATQPLAFQNPGPEPITITGLLSHRDELGLALARGALPVTLAAGDRLDLVVRFTSTGAEEIIGDVDVLAGATVAGRARVTGLTRPQLAFAGVLPVPVGSAYAMPITVRNSAPTARTIAAVTSDVGTVSGLVGTQLAPGAFARGYLTLTADTVGSGIGSVAVMFDTGQGDVRALRREVVAADFAITAEDDTPADAAIDVGVRRAGSGPVERSLTIVNRTDTARTVAECFPLSAPYELVRCPSTIPANGSAQVTVRFTPSATGPAVSSAALLVPGLGVLGGYVTAEVVAQQLEVSVAPLVFPDTPVAGASTATLTIKNIADNPITLPVHVSGDYRAEVAAVTIAPRAQATLTVTFAPTAAGDRDGQLVLGDNGDPDQRVIALLGTAPATAGDAGIEPGGDAGVDAPDDGGCSAGGAGSGLVLLTLLARRRRRPRAVPAR